MTTAEQRVEAAYEEFKANLDEAIADEDDRKVLMGLASRWVNATENLVAREAAQEMRAEREEMAQNVLHGGY